MATEPQPQPLVPDWIQTAFSSLESQKTLITNCLLQWNSLVDHFSSLDKTLTTRSLSLDSQLQSLDSQTKRTLDSLALRESSLPDRESAAAAQIEGLKSSAIAEMEDPDAKAPEDVPSILRWFSRRMDAAGLWRFMISRRKDLAALKREISDAVAASVDPARLVLDAVEDYLAQQEGGGMDRCWALGMLIRALFDAEGRKGPEIGGGIRERAAAVAEAWKGRCEGQGEGKGGGGKNNGSEEQMFLQMVVAFGLSGKFEDGFLKKLVLEHASRKEMAKLASGLGFGEKLGDIIDELVEIGKELEAIYFAYESGLSEKISPASLLKSYYQRSKKNATTILKIGNHSAASIEESSNVELSAIRSIIKCVETHKLEPKYSIDGLKKRVTQLEKAKADRKKTAAANKSQTKRARASGSGGPNFRPSKAVRTAAAPYASYHRNPPAASHLIPPSHHPYNFPVQGGSYDGLTPTPYGTVHSRSPTTIPQQYYMPEDMGGPRSSMPYGGPAVANYGGYDYAAHHTAPAQPQYPH